MTLFKKPDLSVSWFGLGLAGVFIVSVFLRFWHLGRFNTLVFDEVYYAKFASQYLTHTPFFDGHPPLSKYIIALGIWIGNQLPFGHDAINGLTGSSLTPWSYRWLNALTGSFIPLVIAAIAYQLTARRSYSLIAALFAGADGLFLVESRYALNNVYLVIFGLLGQSFFLLALAIKGREPRGNLGQYVYCFLTSGICFGASACIKWNGLWFLLGTYLVWLAGWVVRWLPASTVSSSLQKDGTIASQSANFVTPLKHLTRISIWEVLIFLGAIPALAYRLFWIPHLQLNTSMSFWELQQQILAYHERVGNGPQVHPYCSNWYTWPLMLRPVAYFYETARTTSDRVPSGEQPLPAGVGKVVYDVHAMGNPILWWLSTLAMILLLVMLVQHLWAWGNSRLIADQISAGAAGRTLQTTGFWVGLYLVLNYFANLLPWLDVTRCTFLYHYMGASVFALLAIAGLVDRWLYSDQLRQRQMGMAVISLVLLAFLFWLPIYLGLPLSPLEFRLRMWFPSWI